MGKILPLVIILITSQFLYSQSNWEWLHPKPQGNYLTKVQYVNDNFIVAAGQYGTLIRTTNGGLNWKMDFYDHGNNILDILFINSHTGFYIDSNRVYKTTNSGEEWNISFYSQTNRLVDLDFDEGVLRILHTDSGYSYSENLGNTWNFKMVDPSHYFLQQIKFLNGRGYIRKYNSLLKTTDNGISWTTRVFQWPQHEFQNMYVVNRDTLLFWNPAYGIFYSYNGGDTISFLQNPVGNLYNSSFINNQIGFFGGLHGKFAKVTNFPIQWTDLSLDVNWTIRSVDFLDEQKGAVIGDFGGVATTSNGGLNWKTNYDRFIYDVNSLQFVDENIGYLSTSHDSLLKTTNKGDDWFPILPNEHPYPFGKLAFINADIGWVFKTKFLKINKTTNGGTNWVDQVINNTPNGFTPVDIQFVNESVGFIGGIHSTPIPFYTLMKTTDGGYNWEEIITSGLAKFFFIDSSTGWLGRGGSELSESEIRKTTNGGKSWTLDTVPYPYCFQSLMFIDHLTGYTCGPVGTILKTTNGGLNWFKQHSNFTDDLLKIHFVDSQNGFIGLRGNIMKTINGGENWHKIHIPAYNGIHQMSFVNKDMGWIAGGKSILRTTNGGGAVGIEPVLQAEIPTSFSLSQNYPNPFNPSTNISFEIPSKQKISLIIYNILGRSVAVLLNDVLSAGNYNYAFDASNLPSGVYFYKLSVGNEFSQTKKMLLIK